MWREKKWLQGLFDRPLYKAYFYARRYSHKDTNMAEL